MNKIKSNKDYNLLKKLLNLYQITKYLKNFYKILIKNYIIIYKFKIFKFYL